MESRPIRVLHSVAPAQTYILSRSPYPMRICPIAENSTRKPTQFASVSLKSCIDIIYNSSPEIFSNHQKDFSVYSLDPLESLASVASTSTSSQTISVACGRLSTIRLSDGRATVTGTLVKDVVGQEALQLVFVLYETVALSAVPDPATASRISAALARQMEENGRAQRRRQKQKERRPTKPAVKTEADRILTESGDLCLVQHGNSPLAPPVTPKPFAYRYSSAQTGYPTSTASTASALNTENSHVASTPLPSEAASSSLPGVSAPQNLAPELLSILDTAKHNPQVNSEVLLRVISFIDSATKENASLTIADALRKLAPSQASIGFPHAPQTPPRTPTSNVASTPDDAVVILDKENVNPSVFRRRATYGVEDGKAFASKNGLSSVPVSNPRHELTQQVGPGRSGRFNIKFNNEPAPSGPSTTRKRTLSEVLDEGRSFERIQESNKTFSSPPRFHRTIHLSPGFSRDQPIVIPDSPCMPKSGDQNTQSRTRLKTPYVVPDWARTETAMQPRLSEDAQLMMKDAEKRKQEEKLAKRMKWSQQRKSGVIHRTISTPAVFSTGADESVPSGSAPSLSSKTDLIAISPPPNAPDLLLPVIAVAGTSISLPSFRYRSPSPQPTQSLVPPCTPPRRRVTFSSSSPAEEFSLFTPRGMATPQRGSSVFESPTIARSPCIRPSHVREATPPPSSEPVTGDDNDSCQSNDDDEDFLTQELNEVIAISTVSAVKQPEQAQTADADDDAITDHQDEDEEDGNESGQPFWPGLPPSSPPPQGSPTLQPVVDQSLNDLDDDDDFELPIASSDFDIEEFPPKIEQSIDSETSNIHANADDGAVEGHLDDNTLAAILEMLTSANDNAHPGLSRIADNYEDIFKDLGAVVDETHQSEHGIARHGDGLSEFPSDITLNNPGFWSAVGPLLNQTAHNATAVGEPDPIKKLLSGCVL